jgi:hypothetical protein
MNFRSAPNIQRKDSKNDCARKFKGIGILAIIFSGSQKDILIQMFDSAKHAFYKMACSYSL